MNRAVPWGPGLQLPLNPVMDPHVPHSEYSPGRVKILKTQWLWTCSLPSGSYGTWLQGEVRLERFMPHRL